MAKFPLIKKFSVGDSATGADHVQFPSPEGAYTLTMVDGVDIFFKDADGMWSFVKSLIEKDNYQLPTKVGPKKFKMVYLEKNPNAAMAVKPEVQLSAKVEQPPPDWGKQTVTHQGLPLPPQMKKKGITGMVAQGLTAQQASELGIYHGGSEPGLEPKPLMHIDTDHDPNIQKWECTLVNIDTGLTFTFGITDTDMTHFGPDAAFLLQSMPKAAWVIQKNIVNGGLDPNDFTAWQQEIISILMFNKEKEKK